MTIRRALRQLGLATACLYALAIAAVAVSCTDQSAEPAGVASEVTSSSSVSASATTSKAIATAQPAAAHRPAGKMNVMLIFIDAMRADMPWQGYDRAIAPFLTDLAKRAVVYPRYHSVSSYTAKVLGAVLASRYPSTLYRGGTFFTDYSSANTFFPELLQQAAVRTVGVHAHGYFERSKGLRQGMDVWRIVPGLKWNAETDENVTGPKMNEILFELLGDKQNTGGPFFLWTHYMDPHDKYVVHQGFPRFGRNARDLYDGEIYFTDQLIKQLFEFAEKQPWWSNTVVIIAGDHGEAFGEHNQWKHAFTLWENLTRVPMMVVGPGIAPRRIEARRSHVDLAPTILELMGVEGSASFVGKSIVPELYGAEPDDREPILLDLPADTYNPPTRAIVHGSFKLLEDPGPRYKLFNLDDDPGEQRDLAKVSKHKADFERMKRLFDEAWAKQPYVAPFGGQKLVAGLKADGPKGPPGWQDPDATKSEGN